MNGNDSDSHRLLKQASLASVLTAVGLLLLKLFTFLITGSVAILSSFFDSAQDFLTSLINLFAIKHAIQPADNEHRFGHGNAQALGGLLQGFMIALFSLFLAQESIHRLLKPSPIGHIELGVLVMLIAIAVSILLVSFQTYVVKKTNSLSIKADRMHYTGDILMNAGVIISIIIAEKVGFPVLDAIFGIGVSLYLFYVVFQIMKEAVTQLMDTEISEEFRRQIIKISLSFPEVKRIYHLRTRQSGETLFVQFCVAMDGKLSLQKAHDISHKIEMKIKKTYTHSQIMIHVEPQEK